MSFIARICDILSLAGVGLLLWFGQGMPSVTGGAISVFIVILLSLILAKPFYEVLIQPSGVKLRLEQRFGLAPVYLTLIALLFLMPYIYLMERLNRVESLGLAITLIGFVAIGLYGNYRARRLRRRGISELLSTLLVLGYAGTAGALIAGQVQFSLVALSALALAQAFDWFVFDRFRANFWGVVFAYLIPLSMLATLLIGHGMALLLIGSFLLGTTIIFQSEEAKSPIPRA